MKSFKITVFFLLSASFFSFGQQININPSIIHFHLGNPGAAEVQTLNLTNNSTEVQRFELSLGDWIRTETGGHQYFPPQTKPFSCAAWIQLNKNFVEVQPGTTEEILVNIQAPDNQEDLEKMKWAMIFIQGAVLKKTEEPIDGKARAVISEVVRVGVHVYQTPPSINDQSLKALGLEFNKEEANVYDFLVENTGGIMLNVKAHAELTNIATGEEIMAPKVDMPIFPGGKRKIQLELPKDIKPGKYSLLAIADYGESNPLEAIEKVIEIK